MHTKGGGTGHKSTQGKGEGTGTHKGKGRESGVHSICKAYTRKGGGNVPNNFISPFPIPFVVPSALPSQTLDLNPF